MLIILIPERDVSRSEPFQVASSCQNALQVKIIFIIFPDEVKETEIPPGDVCLVQVQV